MKHRYCAEYKNCKIRPVWHEDIELYRIWRNNEMLSRYLTPVGKITPEMQEKWYKNNQEDPDVISFSVEETVDLKRLVGSASLYEFVGNTAEVGKTIIGDDDARGKSLGFYSELMTVYIGFEKLGLEKIVARIHEDNVASMKRARRLGYTITGKHPFENGGYECELMATKEQFYTTHPFLHEIHIYEE
ncbi:GNAT family N-acetyltransferase [Agathobaculum desmolans]|uniref:GNAT family N-acetyltransferase n=1 Tax=Agathobaculum desmolans TaxID=39484 RepID=UPI0009908564|nr:GNAT family N-acetyltransferase [Agathobaculum desmolans]